MQQTIITVEPQQTPQPAVTLKVTWEEDIRRFSFAGGFNALKDEIYKRYGFKPQLRVSIKYKDDEGDMVTVTDDAELADAKASVTPNGLLKLFLFIKKREPCVMAAPVPVPDAHGQAKVQGTPRPTLVCPTAPLDPTEKQERIKQWKQMRMEQKLQRQQQKMLWKQERIATKAAQVSAKANAPKPPCARYVKDVGPVEDGFEVAPGAKFTKTWRFRNEGAEAWPQGSSLLFISKLKGDVMAGPEAIPVPAVPAGGETDISVPLVAPERPGRYVGHYRLSTTDGKKFGDRVRNLVYVVVSSSSSSEGDAPATSSVDPNSAPFSTALASLEQLGFTHKCLNIKLLRKFKGDLPQVISKLVKHQKKAERKCNKRV